MRRRLAALLLVSAPFAGIAVTAPAADACTGPCAYICDVWNAKPFSNVLGPCGLD